MLDARRERHANVVQFLTDYGQKMREIWEQQNPNPSGDGGDDDWDWDDDDTWDWDNDDWEPPRKLSAVEDTSTTSSTDISVKRYPASATEQIRVPKIKGVCWDGE